MSHNLRFLAPQTHWLIDYGKFDYFFLQWGRKNIIMTSMRSHTRSYDSHLAWCVPFTHINIEFIQFWELKQWQSCCTKIRPEKRLNMIAPDIREGEFGTRMRNKNYPSSYLRQWQQHDSQLFLDFAEQKMSTSMLQLLRSLLMERKPTSFKEAIFSFPRLYFIATRFSLHTLSPSHHS